MNSVNYSDRPFNRSVAISRNDYGRAVDYRFLTAALLSALTILFVAATVLSGPLAG